MVDNRSEELQECVDWLPYLNLDFVIWRNGEYSEREYVHLTFSIYKLPLLVLLEMIQNDTDYVNVGLIRMTVFAWSSATFTELYASRSRTCSHPRRSPNLHPESEDQYDLSKRC